MRYLHCECGAFEMYSSDPVPLCAVCPKCGTTLLTDEFGKRKPQRPHRWRKLYDERTGKPYRRCSQCQRRETISEKPAQRRPPNRPGTPLNDDGTMLGPWDPPVPGGQRG